ncbi:MAG: GNAT family N-acetyltransferase [Oscillospiraceae bacterium]|nr:GNAT family N-acetyltransferase [Oscillospiraceae bacterium]
MIDSKSNDTLPENGIRKLKSLEDIKYLKIPSEPFQIIGRLIPQYKNGVWSTAEEIFDVPYEKKYSDDDISYINNDFINNEDTAIFLYFCDNIYAGHIYMWKGWNKDCYIENIDIRKDFRHQGIGTKLIEQAVLWAKGRDLKGIRLETQDMNLIACRFYQKCGFVLGAVDNLLYRNLENENEKALFWYLLF